MGQRSQIYVRYNGKLIVANYYQWNYAERMISRARHGIEYIRDYADGGYHFAFENGSDILKLRRYFDVNFDMKDIQISHNIIQEHLEYDFGGKFKDDVFYGQDNDDGQLLIDITMKKVDEGENFDAVVKYAFIHWGNHGLLYSRPLTASEYMNADTGLSDWHTSEYLDEDDVKICDNNIHFIENNATLMTEDEVQGFILNEEMYVLDLDDKLLKPLIKITKDAFGYKLVISNDVVYAFDCNIKKHTTDEIMNMLNSMVDRAPFGLLYRVMNSNAETVKKLLDEICEPDTVLVSLDVLNKSNLVEGVDYILYE